MHFGFMTVILLYSTYTEVSATCVAIFRVASAENKCIYSVLGGNTPHLNHVVLDKIRLNGKKQ
jgi:hypothetical protein